MKKILIFVMIGAFLLQGISVISLQVENEFISEKSENIKLSIPNISTTTDNYIDIKYDEATSYIMNPSEPIIPKVTKTFILPFGSHVESINVEYKNEKQIELDGLIRPASDPIIDGTVGKTKSVILSNIYEKNTWYPSEKFDYIQKVGLKEKEHVVFLTVHCYPVKYNPGENILSYAKEIDISFNYYQPMESQIFPDEYELLIIAPDIFSTPLEPLISHKINVAKMNTYMMSLEEIYSTYTEGRDKQEQIKLAIKDAIETKGITYVMLVGGLKGQTTNWLLPVRYGECSSETVISDLYYADIYKLEDDEIVFEDWDSNGDGEFSKWGFSKRDKIDGAPDVYVGRLACRSEKQVNIVVEKIIKYEEQKADDSWFNKMLLIGGDTYADSPGGIPEAEIDTNLSSSYMTGFTFERLWTSLGTLTGQVDVEEAFNEGAGFVHMAGHANPASLVTHPLQDDSKTVIIMSMYEFDDPTHIFPKLNNKDMLPVIVVGGCHNSQFNVGLSNIIRDILIYGINGYFFARPFRFYYMEWVPNCWSWWLTSNPNGGAIATMGNTGLGMGIHDYGYLTGLDGWLFPRFFYHYGQMNKLNIGMAQGLAIADYVNEFNINSDGEDRQMVQQWALLGDPSLLPGGY
ncbi:MAG: peptidase C25 [Thermoplasmatales archaeon]|nr:MAG: peptidase C25 [Thermoplasmatales archaeon]